MSTGGALVQKWETFLEYWWCIGRLSLSTGDALALKCETFLEYWWCRHPGKLQGRRLGARCVMHDACEVSSMGERWSNDFELRRSVLESLA